MGTEQICRVIIFKQACQVWVSPSVNVIIGIAKGHSMSSEIWGRRSFEQFL